MTPPEIALRLKTAGLLPLAERVAARNELLLKHVLELLPHPTSGHVALWTALAKEGKTTAEIASLTSWPVPAIQQALRAPVERQARLEPKVAPRPARKRSGPSPGAVERSLLAKRIDLLEMRLKKLEDGEALGEGAGTTPEVRKVLKEVSDETGVPVRAIVGPSRTTEVVAARTKASARLFGMGMSLKAIGRVLRKDHTTVLARVRKAAA